MKQLNFTFSNAVQRIADALKNVPGAEQRAKRYKLGLGMALVAALFTASSAFAAPAKPTIVLVHGAFADASSWNGVTSILKHDGYPVFAVANPLRGVKSDATYVSDIIKSIPTPVVLVGHSYGGSVISEAADDSANVKGLVYVAAFAPAAGETAAQLSGKFPGGTLASALGNPVHLSTGGDDLYIRQDKFPAQFAADVPEAEAKLMAVAQRPITKEALNEPSTEGAWEHIPSWFIYGDQDKNIPPKVLAFLAQRAHAKQTVVVKGASHVVMVSHPKEVAQLIENAARAQ